MYRRRRKVRNRYYMLVGCVFLIFAGIRIINASEEMETIQMVQESDLEELKSVEDKPTKKNVDSDIRVLILGNGYKGETHSEIRLSSQSTMCLTVDSEKEYIENEKVLVLKPDDKRFKKGKIRISSEEKIRIESLERSYGIPSYAGIIELLSTAEGIVIINELPVEKYLQAVVPSEMPASYELEALKAQAVCARSYAYRQMEEYGYPEYKAHVNDSTDYQVYGNVKSQKKSNQAIKETKGQVVYYNDEIATTYYYSTSGGRTTDMTAWGTEVSSENAYLKSVEVKGKNGDYEKNLPWYRWTAKIPVEKLSDLVSINAGKDIGEIKDVKVLKRGSGNIVLEIQFTGEEGSIKVKTENKIRSTLGGKGYEIILNDGSSTDSRELLPSAFFTIEKSRNVFVIEGGGLGHGIGMSQNGANEMAKQGADYKEILRLFYKDVEVYEVDKK